MEICRKMLLHISLLDRLNPQYSKERNKSCVQDLHDHLRIMPMNHQHSSAQCQMIHPGHAHHVRFQIGDYLLVVRCPSSHSIRIERRFRGH